MRTIVLPLCGLCLAAIAPCFAEPLRLTKQNLSHSDGSRATLAPVKTPHGNALALSYDLADQGWANVSARLPHANMARPITFAFRATAPCTLELKFIQADGATFGQRIAIEPQGDESQGDDFRRLTIYPDDAEHWWGGDGTRGQPQSFDLAVSGATGPGALTILRPTVGLEGQLSSFGPPTPIGTPDAVPARRRGEDQFSLVRAPYRGPFLDPDRELPGFGTRQRRAKTMLPEDPLVVEWLKQMQDAGTPDRRLLPSTPGGDEIHTFNNVLAAMAFVRHGERERAERILDFFRDAASDPDNAEPFRQSFYLRGEPRGFFQRVSLRGASGVAPMQAPPDVDRWMGDMAWLLLACHDHQRTFNSDRYADLSRRLADLLRSWYTPNPNGPGGYVQHGWRRGDSQLHEDHGHHEGNIDCYAVFTLLGDNERAEQIRTWLDAELAGRNDLPLDLYTWRVLADGGRHAELLDIPDFDLRYRKRVPFRGRTIVGPYSGPNAEANNVWLEGAAHLACAYAAAGNLPRANFYANQLDAALIDQQLADQSTRSLPYTVNATGDYTWVNPDEGFTSTAAWYILAKHRFNPLRLETAPQHSE